MVGSQFSKVTLTPQTAAVVMDLAAAGVVAEAADTPFNWYDRTVETAVPNVVPLKPQAPRKPAQAAPKPVVMEKTGAVWAVGDGGGLVVAVRTDLRAMGQIPLNEAEQALLDKMLKAAGLDGDVSGWVGLGQADEQLRPHLGPQMVEALRGLKPTKVLVLGQVALGTLLGESCGVEMWQNNPRGWDDTVGIKGVGVTYPPQLLLQKPLFKRLAWHHLLAWKERWQ